jgi:molybdenum cofactor synthesis domain-containing protein
VGEAEAKPGHGLVGDAHAGSGRQVSLLAEESIQKMRDQGLDVGPGDFAENLTVRGLTLHNLPVGSFLQVGSDVRLRITQIGKECHSPCEIGRRTGACVMPVEGVFAEVLSGGAVRVGDPVRLASDPPLAGGAAPLRFRFAVLTVSDRSAGGEREDTTGPAIAAALEAIGGERADYRIVPDDREAIREALLEMCASGIPLVLTDGGTGFGPRDVAPEATADVIERPAPGIAEAIRAASLRITAAAMLSRAIAGLRGGTLIVNLPGSPRGARECLEVFLPALPHALEVLAGGTHDCASRERTPLNTDR